MNQSIQALYRTPYVVVKLGLPGVHTGKYSNWRHKQNDPRVPPITSGMQKLCPSLINIRIVFIFPIIL